MCQKKNTFIKVKTLGLIAVGAQKWWGLLAVMSLLRK